MVSIPLRDLTGADLGVVEVSDEVFAAPINESLVHQAVVRLLANRRLGAHKVKTRSEVSGGGAKPWRQKGTGRARQGSRVSPLWRGGGIVFGPELRSYRQAMPKKMQRIALRGGLSSRCNEGAMIALDVFEFPEPKTRGFVNAVSSLGLTGNILVIDETFEPNAFLAARNVPDIGLRDADSLNLIDVLQWTNLVFTKAALESIDRRLNNGSR